MKPAGEVAEIGYRFEKLLARERIPIPTGSHLEAALLAVTEWHVAADDYGLTSLEPDIRPGIRRRLSFLNLAHKVLLADERGSLPLLLPHLRLLSNGDPSMIGPSTHETATHQTLEMLVAVAADEVFDDVELEDPVSPSGRTPDVAFTAEGMRWGIACKMVSSESPITLTERIVEGVKQVEKSEVDIGFCLVWFRSFDHNRLWSSNVRDDGIVLTSRERDQDYWRPIMEGYLAERFSGVVEHVGKQNLGGLFSSRKTPKTVVGIVESVGSFDGFGLGVIRRLSAGVTQGMTGLGLCTPYSVLERLGNAISRDPGRQGE